MQIQISWRLKKSIVPILHCLQRQGISRFSRTRVNILGVVFHSNYIVALPTFHKMRIIIENEQQHEEKYYLIELRSDVTFNNLLVMS